MTDQIERTERAHPLGSLGSEVVSVMHEIVEQLLALPGADGASLSEIDGDSVHFEVSLGADEPLRGRTFTVADGAGVLTLDMDGPIVIRAEPGTTIPNMLLDGAAVIMLAPVSYGGSKRGILGVRSPEPDAFDDADCASLGMLARSAGIALQQRCARRKPARRRRDAERAVGARARSQRRPAGNRFAGSATHTRRWFGRGALRR